MRKVLNTRPREQAGPLSASLEAAGFVSVEIPLVELNSIASGLEEVAGLDPNSFTGIFLSSPIGLKAMQSAMPADLFEPWIEKPFYSVGKQSRSLIEGMGGVVNFIPHEASLTGFTKEYPEWSNSQGTSPTIPQRWLHPCSEKTRLDPERFTHFGVEVVNVAVYRPQIPAQAESLLPELEDDFMAALFCSGSAVDHFFEAAPQRAERWKKNMPAASLGTSTTEALLRQGWQHITQAPTADGPGLLAAIKKIAGDPLFANNEKMQLHAERYARAARVIPGGVNSPVRAFKSVGGTPVFMASAKGPYLIDADGNRFTDFVLSWGPMILGHAHPAVIEAVHRAVDRGLSFGACTEAETEMAETLCRLLPSLEKVRLVCSGTEATMSAVRLARGFTGREKIIKFRGCYHGHGDSFLVQAGSGLITFGNPSSPGVTHGSAQDTLIADFNDLASVEKLFTEYPQSIAAIIVEPVVGNMGVLIPEDGFLAGLRKLCDGQKTLLIFDEVMTGFRVGLQCAQGRYGVQPDLTTLGKVVGGGMPLAAYGGRRDIMDALSPLGPVYQAGTLSGNPIAVAAGLATLREIEEPGFYDRLENLSARWERDLTTAFARSPFPIQINRVGSMLTLFFAGETVRDYGSALKSNTLTYGRYFQAMLAEGIYLAPSQFEAGFLSLAHDESVLSQVAEATQRVVKCLAQ